MSEIMESVQVKSLIEIGLEKGYLQDRKVFLIPIPGKRLTLVTKDPVSAHSFMYEGATLDFCLPVNDRLDYFNPFDSEDEKKFFEKILETDLGFSGRFNDPKCFWSSANFHISFTVDANIKSNGYELDLRNPTDVLRYKVLKMQYNIAPDMESVVNPLTNRPHWQWVLKSSEYQDTSKSKLGLQKTKAYKFFGSIQDHQSKMVEFLNLFFANTKQNKEIAENTSISALNANIEEIIEQHLETFIQVIEDDELEIKTLILKGAKSGGIERHGLNSYSFPGGLKYTFDEFVDQVKAAKETQDEYYLKLLAHFQTREKLSKVRTSKTAE